VLAEGVGKTRQGPPLVLGEAYASADSLAAFVQTIELLAHATGQRFASPPVSN
jgi:hypothetical protein